MHRSIPALLALLVVLAAFGLPAITAQADFMSPTERWCFANTADNQLRYFADTGRMDVVDPLLSRVKANAVRCRIAFSTPVTIALDNSQGEVTINGSRVNSWQDDIANVSSLEIYYPSANNAAGFVVWVKSAAPTPTPSPTWTPGPTPIPITTGRKVVVPEAAWCYSESEKLDWNLQLGRLSVVEPVLGKLRTTVGRCEVYFPQTGVQVLISISRGEVWNGSTMLLKDQPVVNFPVTVTGKQLTINVPNPGDGVGFEIRVVTTLPDRRVWIPKVDRDKRVEIAPTPSSLPEGHKFVAPTGAWCGDPSRTLKFDENSGSLWMEEPLLSQIRQTPSRINCEIFFDRPVTVVLQNTTGEVWLKENFVGTEMNRALAVASQLTIVYTKASDANGFAARVQTTTPR